MESYKYLTGNRANLEEHTAVRATSAERAEERKQMESKGFVYCESRINDRDFAYWYEVKWQHELRGDNKILMKNLFEDIARKRGMRAGKVA